MNRAWVIFAALVLLGLTACGGGNGSGSFSDRMGGDSSPRPVPATLKGHVPPSPEPGERRPGRDYRIVIEGAHGEDVVFQVFEPTTFVGGENYPLIFESHGFGGSRRIDRESGGGPPSLSPDIGMLLAAGYGVISIDQRGHGESGGTIRIMDPDFAGRNMVRVLDWAEANLDWLAYGPDADAGEVNLRLGAVGASYGGGAMFVLNAADPEKRMDAMVPQITWNDLTYSLNPQNVIKSGWVVPLYAVGAIAGSGLNRLNFDPFVRQLLAKAVANNKISEFGEEFLRYHGPGYFCSGRPVATNGGKGTEPRFAPTPPGPVNVMLWQGMRDTLFNFTEAWRNYRCFEQAGGDVRLLSYQSGHNAVPFPLDLSVIVKPGYLTTLLDTDCGGVGVSEATLAFFNEHLKGREGAADAIPEVCISLTADKDYVTDHVPVGGETFQIPPRTVTSGLGLPDVPIQIIPLNFSAEAGDTLAGVPTITIKVERATGDGTLTGDEPILFLALGQTSGPLDVYERVDNQVTPIRGFGVHKLKMPGVGFDLQAGDKLALLVYAIQTQYVITGNLSLGDILTSLKPLLKSGDGDLLNLPVVRVHLSGKISLPLVRDQAEP